ncbi:MAG TPA: ankyrin repeat domain-containing protein [Bryobacteraceae bacterium]|nr:ankyrin repeat domain-containing protein [Bryobacteraceae bacterium]
MVFRRSLLWAPLLFLYGCASQRPSVSLISGAAAGDTGGMRKLLAQGVDVNRKNERGLTALIAAVRAGSVPAVRMLLEHGADPNLPGGVNGWTPLMHAVHKNRIITAQALLDGGAQVDSRGRSGETALMMAAGYGYTAMVGLLLDRGADPRAETHDGFNVLAAALGGVPDIDRFTLGSCQAETVHLLKRRYPDLHLPNNLWARVAQAAGGVAKLRGCSY